MSTSTSSRSQSDAASVVRHREPARDAPLSWGTYPLRYGLGLALIWLGPLLVVRETTIVYRYMTVRNANLGIETLGYALLVAGWLVLPGRRSLRTGAAAIALMSLLAHGHGLPAIGWRPSGHFYEWIFHGPFGTPAQLIAVVGMLAAWLLVRERPGLTWTLLPAGVVLHLLLSSDRQLYFFDTLLPTLQLGDFQTSITLRLALGWVVLVVLPAWAARLLAPRLSRAAAARRETQVARTAVLAEQRAAFVSAPGGPGAGGAVGDPSRTTNTFAILALVFGILGGYLAVVFGHIAKSQIRKTGQGGSGMATAGLILGYAWVAVSIGFLIYAAVVVGQLNAALS